MYNPTDNEILLQVHNMHLYYNHTVYSFPPYTFLWSEEGPQWPKHVVISIINRIQESCVLTYPTLSLIAKNTTGMMQLTISCYMFQLNGQHQGADTCITKTYRNKRVLQCLRICMFCMGVKRGRSHWGRNVGWGCLRIGCWGEYLGLRGTRQQGKRLSRPQGHNMIGRILCQWKIHWHQLGSNQRPSNL